jgi:uncharacterized protein YndB with AHSA1/START domain
VRADDRIRTWRSGPCEMNKSFENRSTSVSKIIRAERKSVYNAFLDPDAVAMWLAPENMTGQVHAFEAHEGGAFRMSLTYQGTGHLPGKTSEHTDTFQGRFVELVPNTRIVEVVQFESQDPAFAGEMKMTVNLADAEGGTEVTLVCENIPPGIRLQDNEQGSKESLAKLAALLEGCRISRR